MNEVVCSVLFCWGLAFRWSPASLSITSGRGAVIHIGTSFLGFSDDRPNEEDADLTFGFGPTRCPDKFLQKREKKKKGCHTCHWGPQMRALVLKTLLFFFIR